MARQTFHGDPIALLGGDPPEFDIVEVVDFQQDYVYKEHVVCHLRHCRQKHNKGRIVLLVSGKESVIGGCCARRHLGYARFADLDSKLKVAQRVDLVRVSISNPDFRPDLALATLRNSYETVKIVDSAQRHFRTSHSLTWNTLAAIAAGTGVLSECRFRCGQVEYGHYDEFGDWYIKRTVPVAKKPTQILRGAPFFATPRISAAFLQADLLLEGLAALFNGVVEVTEKRLLAVPKEIKEARRLVSEIISVVNGYVEFIEPSNVSAVARWIERTDIGQFRGEATPDGLGIFNYVPSMNKWNYQFIRLSKVDWLDPSVINMFADKGMSEAA